MTQEKGPEGKTCRRELFIYIFLTNKNTNYTQKHQQLISPKFYLEKCANDQKSLLYGTTLNVVRNSLIFVPNLTVRRPLDFCANLLYETTASAVQILYKIVQFPYLEIHVVLCLNFHANILNLCAPSLFYDLQLMLLYGSNKCCTTALGSVQNFSLKFVLSLSLLNFVPSLPRNYCRKYPWDLCKFLAQKFALSPPLTQKFSFILFSLLSLKLCFSFTLNLLFKE